MTPSRFPYEINDLILKALPPGSKQTLLACAEVCRAWVAVSRRQLCSLYFPDGQITLHPCGSEILTLIEIFQSPFCTLNPGFIKAFELTIMKGAVEDWPSFFDAFPGLDTIAVSLEAIRLRRVRLILASEAWRRLESTAITTLSSIKRLTYDGIWEDWCWPIPKGTPFSYLVRLSCLCARLEEMQVLSPDHSYSNNPIKANKFYSSQKPPKSLRVLNVDCGGASGMADWMLQGRPTQATSVIFYNVEWRLPDYAELLLHRLGDRVEELEVRRPYDPEWDYEQAISKLDEFITPLEDSFFPLEVSTSLKRIKVVAGLHMIILFLCDCVFKTQELVPKLEVLELEITACSKELGALEEPLDEHILSRTSLHRITVSKTPDAECELGWAEVQGYLKRLLPGCDSRGFLSFVGDVEHY